MLAPPSRQQSSRPIHRPGRPGSPNQPTRSRGVIRLGTTLPPGPDVPVYPKAIQASGAIGHVLLEILRSASQNGFLRVLEEKAQVPWPPPAR